MDVTAFVQTTEEKLKLKIFANCETKKKHITKQKQA